MSRTIGGLNLIQLVWPPRSGGCDACPQGHGAEWCNAARPQEQTFAQIDAVQIEDMIICRIKNIE